MKKCLSLALLWWSAAAHASGISGMCVNDDADIAIAILANGEGQILDLALTVGEHRISRFPAANATRILMPGHRYRFSAKRQKQHEALELEIAGTRGRARHQGKTLALACSWNQ